MNIFSQNAYLRKVGVYSWNIPAHFVKFEDGSKFYTCPNAGVCGALCYAKAGAYQFGNVKRNHIEKLRWVLDDMPGWKEAVNKELGKMKYTRKFIRIHDAGDFFSREYAEAWIDIASSNGQCRFYAYTKEVDLFKNQLKDLIPRNFTLIYSFGGKQDHLIDKETDRHSDVFLSLDELLQAGYVPVQSDDTLACTHPNNKIGLVSNNIPHLRKKQGTKRFSEFAK